MDLTLIERIHPAVSSFPLAFIVLLGSSELLLGNSQKQVVIPVILTALGIALVTTFLSGYVTGPFLSVEEPKDVVVSHHVWGRIGLYGYGAVLSSWWWQRTGQSRFWRMFYLLALGISLITIGRASMKGGELVFSHGIGIAQSSHEQTSQNTRP